MKKYVLILPFLGLFTNVLAGDREMYLKKGMPYQAAKRELRRGGWSPRKMHTKDDYAYVGIENTMRAYGVSGIESCALDRPICILHYVKSNMCLRVFTWGEEFKDLKIDSWDRACPPADAL
jgi:hypothetical protein